MLVLTAALCVWLGIQVNAARRQRDAVAAIVKAGGDVRYDYQMVVGPDGFDFDLSIDPPAPAWMRRIFGDDFFRNAECVGLTGCTISESDWKQLARLPRLRRVGLNGASIISDGSKAKRRFTDSDIDVLRSLTELRSFWLSYSDIEGSGLASLCNSKLVEITLYNSPVADAGLEQIGKLMTLKSVTLDSQLITDAGLQYLKTLPSLERLNLVGAPVTDAAVRHLKGLTTLNELYGVSGKITDESVAELQKALPNTKIH